MIRYLNCTELELTQDDKDVYSSKVKSIFTNGVIFKKIKCNNCLRTYLVHTDGQKAPSKFAGREECTCGLGLLEYNTSDEPYLLEIKSTT